MVFRFARGFRSAPAWGVFVLLGLLMLGRAAHAQFLYGITDGGSLYEINPVSQVTGLVYSQTLTMSGANGLAWDNTNQRLFYFGTVGGTARFYVWNRVTGVQTQLTGTLPGGSVASGTFYNNSFWYVKNATDTLVRMNLDFSSASAPVISSYQLFTNFDGGATSSFSFGDISVRASDGVLFGSSDQGVFSVNIAGATPTGFSQINSNANMYQIGFGQNGVLYGEAAASGKWYTVNQNTGVATTLNYTSTNSSGAVAFNDISEGATQGVFGAPEPGSIVLVLAGGGGPLLVGLAKAKKRRKN